MTSSLRALAGCAILTAAAPLAAQQPPANRPPIQQASATAPAATAAPAVVPVRTAVVNINKVLKNFNKAQQLNQFISAKVQKYATDMNLKREDMNKLQAEMAKAVDPNQREAIEKQILNIQRHLQDMDGEARKDISTQQGQIAVGIYKDIEGVIQRVAVANGFDLVMSYPDATTDAEMYSQANVVRKLASQAAIPLYYKPHIDITDAVVQTLNATFPTAPTQQPPAASTPAPRQ